MKVIVGLGNPGPEYIKTRHNSGFLAVEALASKLGVGFDRRGFEAEYTIIKNAALLEPIALLKPQTFMNKSGTAVSLFLNYFHLSADDLLVVYDEMALEPGSIRLKPGGSSAGHKGIQDIIEKTHTDKIARLKIGIGEPPHKDAVSFVLGTPSGEEKNKWQNGIIRAVDALEDIIHHDFYHAMNIYNKKES